MDNLALLRSQLNAANVSDDTISRGIRLTARGMKKLAAKLNTSEDGLMGMLTQLSKQVKAELAPTGLPASPDILEDTEDRFTYEADFMGNVTLRDNKSGATKYLQGSEGAKLLSEIERVGIHFQGVIAPYFNSDHLMELARADVATDDNGNNGGTYNFPFMGNFAVARFWLAGMKPMVEVVSILDAEGNEVAVDDSTKAEAERTAWEWVNKV